MADDMFDTEDDVVSTEDQQSGQKRVGFLPGVVIQILKWVGIVLGAVIFIVTVVVVTMMFLNRDTVSQTVMPTSEDYAAEVPIYAWSEQIGELRGTTADEQRTTYIIEPFLGYDGENNALVAELIQRRIQLIGIFNDYFFSKTVAELQGSERQAAVELELLSQINRTLREGRVEDIVWGSYQFLPF